VTDGGPYDKSFVRTQRIDSGWKEIIRPGSRVSFIDVRSTAWEKIFLVIDGCIVSRRVTGYKLMIHPLHIRFRASIVD
jgi:hypothetical protein